jgi:hypothetical protein
MLHVTLAALSELSTHVQILGRESERMEQVELATSAGDSHSGSADTQQIQTAQATTSEANEEGDMCGPLR